MPDTINLIKVTYVGYNWRNLLVSMCVIVATISSIYHFSNEDNKKYVDNDIIWVSSIGSFIFLAILFYRIPQIINWWTQTESHVPSMPSMPSMLSKSSSETQASTPDTMTSSSTSLPTLSGLSTKMKIIMSFATTIVLPGGVYVGINPDDFFTTLGQDNLPLGTTVGNVSLALVLYSILVFCTGVLAWLIPNLISNLISNTRQIKDWGLFVSGLLAFSASVPAFILWSLLLAENVGGYKTSEYKWPALILTGVAGMMVLLTAIRWVTKRNQENTTST